MFMNELINQIKKLDIGEVEENISLAKRTTYRSGGIARCIVYPKTTKTLVKLIDLLKGSGVGFKILGNGSNLLFSDQEYQKILIRLTKLDDVQFYGKTKVRVGAGFSLIKLSLLAAKKGLTGLEFAAGIPGTVGGAVYMNAGAYKSDMGYIVESVKVLTPDLKNLYIVLANIKLEQGDEQEILERVSKRRVKRLETQPLDMPSAGSVFRNPEGGFAGKLIEDAGLKGKTHGGAMISDKHANFIVNYNHASSADIKYLIDLAHDEVLKRYGVDLKIEQEFVNWE